MLVINKIEPILQLFFFLSKRRKVQIWFLIFLQLINGIFEFFSISAILPFLSIFALNDDVNGIPIVGSLFVFFGIKDVSQSFFIITLFFCIFILISTFFRLFNLKYTYNLAANIEIELSKKIFKDNILQPYINYTRKNSSEVMSITTEKVSATANAFCSFLILIGSVILGIFIVGSLLLINWQIISAASFLLLLYYLIIFKKVSKTIYRNGKQIAFISPKRLRLIQEVFIGFRDIVVNGTEKVYIEMFNKLDSEYKLRAANSRFISIFPRYLIEGLVIFMLVIVGYNFSLLKFNFISFIPVFGSAIYAFQKLLPLIQLIYATWADYRARYPSIIDVMGELKSNQNNKQSIHRKEDLFFNNSIEFRNIYFKYDSSKYILNDINFKINKGEHIGIFGETGSGKSTLIDVIIGLLPPSKGDILIDEVSLKKGKYNFNWTTKIAHVSQSIFLKEGTIAENIAYGQSPNEFDFELLEKASKMAHIYDFIQEKELGFDTNVGERGINLSGGQRQRITIARAIYKSREILVLDEATSALDNKTEEKIINSIKNNSKLTILMVTHRQKSLVNCDRVFKIQNNKLIEKNKNEFN